MNCSLTLAISLEPKAYAKGNTAGKTLKHRSDLVTSLPHSSMAAVILGKSQKLCSEGPLRSLRSSSVHPRINSCRGHLFPHRLLITPPFILTSVLSRDIYGQPTCTTLFHKAFTLTRPIYQQVSRREKLFHTFL